MTECEWSNVFSAVNVLVTGATGAFIYKHFKSNSKVDNFQYDKEVFEMSVKLFRENIESVKNRIEQDFTFSAEDKTSINRCLSIDNRIIVEDKNLHNLNLKFLTFRGVYLDKNFINKMPYDPSLYLNLLNSPRIMFSITNLMYIVTEFNAFFNNLIKDFLEISDKNIKRKAGIYIVDFWNNEYIGFYGHFNVYFEQTIDMVFPCMDAEVESKFVQQTKEEIQNLKDKILNVKQNIKKFTGSSILW